MVPAAVGLEQVELVTPVDADLACAAIASEEAREVRVAVEALPEHERSVIALHYLRFRASRWRIVETQGGPGPRRWPDG